MSSHREQRLIDAPVEAVWRQVGDPNRYPDWAGEVVEVAGLDEVRRGARYEATAKRMLRNRTTVFEIDELEEMREISVRCTVSGYYVRWLLTEAGDDTFAEVEVGMRPTHAGYRVIDKTVGRRWYREVVDDLLVRLRETLR